MRDLTALRAANDAAFNTPKARAARAKYAGSGEHMRDHLRRIVFHAGRALAAGRSVRDAIPAADRTIARLTFPAIFAPDTATARRAVAIAARALGLRGALLHGFVDFAERVAADSDDDELRLSLISAYEALTQGAHQ